MFQIPTYFDQSDSFKIGVRDQDHFLKTDLTVLDFAKIIFCYSSECDKMISSY